MASTVRWMLSQDPIDIPFPYIQDFRAILNKTNIYRKVNLIYTLRQIPVAPEDTPKIADITPFGLSEYLQIPFQLRYKTRSFRRFVNEGRRELPFVFTHTDDILITSLSVET